MLPYNYSVYLLNCGSSSQSYSYVFIIHIFYSYFRDFIEQHYVTLKKANPEFPILIRECSGVHPTLWARYGFGKERSVSLDNMNADQVAKALESVVNAKP
ncbi:NADH dehydrogenase [ubiquinone] 1 alpha subcomplex subunit 2 [Labeo rohita]|uniref:NADH dehydrogenase [ubiquinone] 1 alpha subcomplex subunit 2 n=1 Tax=Labeo rohita TaxID=84645 RepID=A0ABQ8LKW0_LABRO|nr:NADH dehydrogenase [ubiquinone] 1 alpha subcomplex subunit 2 [Labeo rohita]